MPRARLTEKECPDCHVVKPREEYPIQRRNQMGPYCKACAPAHAPTKADKAARRDAKRDTAVLADAGLPPPVRLPTAAVAPRDILDAALTVPVRKKLIKTAIGLALGEGGQKPDRALLSYLMERVFGPVKSAQPPGDGDDLVGIAAEISAIALATRRERGPGGGADDPLAAGGLSADPEPVGLPYGDPALEPDGAAE